MSHFVVGEHVVIRWGKHQGQKARIMTIAADVHKVKIEDGSVGFFSGKGLEKERIVN
jgi:ribosomal protein L24